VPHGAHPEVCLDELPRVLRSFLPLPSVDSLRSKWYRDMPFEAIIRLRDDLDGMLQKIRSERQIRPPVSRCPKCGHVGERTPPHVSIRAMILSVIRFDIDDVDATRAVERQWKVYQ
jgi:hypothetical protein